MAYGVEGLLRKYGQANLNEDGARVVAAAEKCVEKPAATPPTTAAPTGIPIVPVVAAVGALGVIGLIVALAK